jgi:Lysozyme like domain/Ricin-type beta-trefoil lectin domain
MHILNQPSRLTRPRRALRLALLLPTVTGLLIAGATAQAATAPPPATAHGKPASLGPGLGKPAPDDTLSEAQVCAKVAAKAGFSYSNDISTNNGGSYPVIVVAVSIGLAESTCNPSASYTNPGGCVDRGMWQIDNCAWPNVSNDCAYQVQCNANAAFNISSKGYDWCDWSTYSPNGPSDCGSPGPYTSYLSLAEQAIYGFDFQLENQSDGTCLDADSSSKGNGGKIFQWTCNSSDAYQQWYVEGSLGHNPVLKNAGTGTCLDLDAGEVGNADPVFQWSCNTGDSYQQWWWYGSGELNTNGNADAGMHVDGESKTCLDADGSSKGNGAPIFQWACSQSDGFQQWN